MNTAPDKTPFYKRLAFNLFSVTTIGVVLHVGSSIVTPLLFAILLAVLLLPGIRFFEKGGFNRVCAILFTMALALTIIFSVVYFLSRQVFDFLGDFDMIQERFNVLSSTLQHWVKSQFGITITRQNQYIQHTKENMDAAAILGSTVISITSLLSYVILLPIYTFLILYYRDLIKQFLVSVFKYKHADNVREILYESRAVSQRYIVGLMTDMGIVFALYATGFLVLGVQYALFMAVMAAVLNLLPYIGMIIANFVCMLITLLLSENLSDVFWVGAIILFVHFIDNNILLPRIVGSRVKINALVTLVGVLVGGAICGVPGMFLSVPGLAVLKVIFDRIDELKPYGLMLGGETMKSSRTPAPHS